MKPMTLFFSISSMILLVFTVVDVYAMSNPQQFHYGPVLWAETLSTKPEKYIVVTDPDPYLLEALLNPEECVFVGSWENTNFDELLDRYKTTNVEYDNAYYEVTLGSLDAFVYGTFLWILIFSWIGLGLSYIIIYARARMSRLCYGFCFVIVTLPFSASTLTKSPV